MKLLICLVLLLSLAACASSGGLTAMQDMTAAGAAVGAATAASTVGTPLAGVIVGGITWLVTVLFMGRTPFEVHGTTEALAGAPSNPGTGGLSTTWWLAIGFAVVCLAVYFVRRTDFFGFVWDALPLPKKTRKSTTEVRS